MVYQIRSKYGMPWGGMHATAEAAAATLATRPDAAEWTVVKVTAEEAVAAHREFWPHTSVSYSREDADERAIHGGKR